MTKLPTEGRIIDEYELYLMKCKKDDELPTKLGICLWFGISRPTYNQWKKKSNALKEIEGRTEQAWVQKLTKQSVAGIIFYLKNAFGYRDNKGVDLTSGNKPIPLFDYVKQNRNNQRDGKNKKPKEKNKNLPRRNISK